MAAINTWGTVNSWEGSTTPVTATYDLDWGKSVSTQTSLGLDWDKRISTQTSLGLDWDKRISVSKQVTLDWNKLTANAPVAKSLTLDWNKYAVITPVVLTVDWGKLTDNELVSKDLVLNWDKRKSVSYNITIPWSKSNDFGITPITPITTQLDWDKLVFTLTTPLTRTMIIALEDRTMVLR